MSKVVESYQLEFKRNVTPRVERLYQNAIDAVPSVCIDRAKYFTESYKQTEGESVNIRKAKAIKNTLEKMHIYILDGELIVGNVASKPRASVVCPEFNTNYLMKEFNDELKTPENRPYDRHTLTPEIKKYLQEEIFPYWKDKTVEYYVTQELDEETINASIPSLSKVNTIPAGSEIHLRHGAGHLNADYKKILTRGALGIIEEVQSKLNVETDPDKIDFYTSLIIVYQAFIDFAKRYAELAIEMAKNEKDIKRKNELMEIARICTKVPAYPAETFHEALQSFWFTQILLFGIDQEDTAISPGRMDQYLYPYYKADIESGRATKDDIQELIELLFIKFAHMSILWDYSTANYYAGFSLTQTIIVGGVDKEGNDATNELTYMFLEAEKQVPLFQPEFAARIHKNSPFEYLVKLAEVCRLGHGKPKIFVDEAAIPALLRRGHSLEDARDYCIVGCVEPSSSGNMFGWTNACSFNLAKCMELVMTQGKCLVTGEQIGPRTQDPLTFENMDQVLEAFKQQVSYFLSYTIKAINTFIKYHGKLAPNLFTSALIDGCIESGLDVTRGGAKYKAIGINGVASPDVGDSLAAISYCVFDKKLLSMKDIVEAIKADFKGYEKVRDILLYQAPKYGNDIDYVDNYVKIVGQIWCNEVEKYEGPHGEKYWPGQFTVSSNVPFGLVTGALPSGRHAFEPLANGGISATNGSDMNGPTALIKSVAKLDHVKACNGTLLNMRFSPQVLKEDRDIVKFANFLRAYCLLGGYHVQFNVVSSELLKKAQKNPEKYRNLLVRVAGYSAYFTELSVDVQNDLINRTVHEEV